MPKPSPDPGRRWMLARTRNAAAAGVALAVLGPVAQSQSRPADAGPATPQPAGKRGYHATEHTQRYYDLARY